MKTIYQESDMIVQNGIAQANTYAGARQALTFQLIIVAFLLGAFSDSWWWSAAVPIAMIFLTGFRLFRLAVIGLLMAGSASIAYLICLEVGGGHLIAITASLFAAFISAAINSAGMTGLVQAVPDFKH